MHTYYCTTIVCDIVKGRGRQPISKTKKLRPDKHLKY